MRKHTLIGERIIAAAPALVPIARLVRSSHERWDGGGYPDGLAGEAIPLGSRIVFCCDAFDAMVSERPYSVAMRPARALEEVERGAGSQFDPTGGRGAARGRRVAQWWRWRSSRYEPRHLDALLALCKAEGWISFAANPERAGRAMTGPGVTALVAVERRRRRRGTRRRRVGRRGRSASPRRSATAPSAATSACCWSTRRRAAAGSARRWSSATLVESGVLAPRPALLRPGDVALRTLPPQPDPRLPPLPGREPHPARGAVDLTHL